LYKFPNIVKQGLLKIDSLALALRSYPLFYFAWYRGCFAGKETIFYQFYHIYVLLSVFAIVCTDLFPDRFFRHHQLKLKKRN